MKAMSKWDLIAEVVPQLKKMGCRYEINTPVSVSHHVRGYKKLYIDIAVLDKHGNLIRAFFIGPPKERRMVKYKLLKVPVYYIHTQEDLAKEIRRFKIGYIVALFNT